MENTDQVLSFLIKNKKPLVAYAKRIVKDYERAEDCFQEVCLKVIKNDLRGDLGINFFFNTIKNVALNTDKVNRKYKFSGELSSIGEDFFIESAASKAKNITGHENNSIDILEKEDLIRKALCKMHSIKNSLSAKQKIQFEKKLQEGTLDTSESCYDTAKTTYKNAFIKVRQEMLEYFAGNENEIRKSLGDI